MAASTPAARADAARKAALASWRTTGDDPVARRARTRPGRIASARRLLATVETQARDGAA
jgi:hypothetical protein